MMKRCAAWARNPAGSLAAGIADRVIIIEGDDTFHAMELEAW